MGLLAPTRPVQGRRLVWQQRRRRPRQAAAAKKTTTRRATTNKAKAATEVTYEMIAERAYHIAESGEGGSDEENWHRAEAELKSA